MKSIHASSSCVWNTTRVPWENDSPRPHSFDNWHVTTGGSMRPSQDIHIYYHRPPDRTDRFIQRLIHDDPWVKITFAQGLTLARPLKIGGEVALEEGADAADGMADRMRNPWRGKEEEEAPTDEAAPVQGVQGRYASLRAPVVFSGNIDSKHQ